jgi:hypothetical protein
MGSIPSIILKLYYSIPKMYHFALEKTKDKTEVGRWKMAPSSDTVPRGGTSL